MHKMATNYLSNEQRTNYSRLCRAIIDLSANVLRELLKSQVSPSHILTSVNKTPKSKLNFIKKDQWKTICEAVLIGTYEKFDLTLLILVIRLLSVQNVCNILEASIPYQDLQTTLQSCPALSSDPQTKLSQQELNDIQSIITNKSYENLKDELLWKLYTHLCPSTHKNLFLPSVKWGNAAMPDPAHTTVGDDVERLRHLRNKAYGHVFTTEITKQEFDNSWKELEGIMVRMDKTLLGHNFKASLDKIKNVCMDPELEKKILKEIKNMADDDKKVQDDVTKLKNDVSEIKDNVSELPVDVSEIKDNVSELTVDVSEIKDNVSELTVEVSEIKDNISELTVDVSEIKDNVSELTVDVSEIKEEVQQVKGAIISEETRKCESAIMSETRKCEIHTKFQIDTHKEDKTFVVTPVVSKGIDILTQHGILIYSGRPGHGKTKNALEIMNQLRERNPDWTFLELNEMEIKKWKSLIDPTVPSVILLNDVIGKTNIKTDLIDDGDEHFPNILANVKQGKVKVIMTIRKYLLDKNAIKLEKYELFDPRYTIDLTSEQFKLDTDTKEVILRRHCEHNNIEICKTLMNFNVDDEKTVIRISNWTKYEIVQTDPVLGFPYACYLFCCKRHYTQLGVKFFKQPTRCVIEDIKKLINLEATKLEKIQYCVMVYMLMKNGRFGDFDIQIFNKVIESIELPEHPKKIEREEAIEKLLDKYIVRGVHSQYEFKHQTILESVAVCFIKTDPCLLLEVCSQDFITEFVRPENFQETEGEVVCKVERKVYKTVVNRIVYSVENCRSSYNQYAWWARHPLLSDETFVNCLVSEILSKANDQNSNLCVVDLFDSLCTFTNNTLILDKLYNALTPTQVKRRSYVVKVSNKEVTKWLLDHNIVNDEIITFALKYWDPFANHQIVTVDNVVKYLKQGYYIYDSSFINDVFSRWPCIEKSHVQDILKQLICGGQQLDCIKTVVDCRPDIITDEMIKTMFSLACVVRERNLEIIEYLLNLDKGKFNSKTVHINNANDDNLTNLHFAAFFGKVDVCMKLIDLGLRLDVRTKSGLSVLQVAILGYCCRRYRDIKFIKSYVKTLFDTFGPQMNYYSYHQIYLILFEFICFENSLIIDYTDFDMTVDEYGSKLLHHCVKNHDLAMIELLHKINNRLVHATNKDNMSGLHIAAIFGYFDIFLKFVEFGVFDTDTQSESRLSVLRLVTIGMICFIPKAVLRALNLTSNLESSTIDYYERHRILYYGTSKHKFEEFENKSVMNPIFAWLSQHQIYMTKKNESYLNISELNRSKSYALTIIYLMHYDKHFDKDLDLVVKEFGSAIAISCVFHDDLSLFDMFYNIDKRPFHVTNEQNILAIHFAAYFGKLEMFMKLVEIGTSVSGHICGISKRNILRFTLIGFTKYGLRCYLEEFPFLRGCKVDYVFRFGTLQSYEKIITYLLDHTELLLSDLDVEVDDFGNSFTHYCVAFNSVSLIQLLHTKHPDILSGMIATKSKRKPDIRNRQMTPIQLSVIMGRSEILKLLLSYNNVVNIDINNLIQLVSEGKKYKGYDLQIYIIPDFLYFIPSNYAHQREFKFGSEDDYQSISETLESLTKEKQKQPTASELTCCETEMESVDDCHSVSRAQGNHGSRENRKRNRDEFV